MTTAAPMDRPATVRVNGEVAPLTAETVLALLTQRGIDPDARGLAVAVNGMVVPRRAWSERALARDDEVEIVKPFAGG